MNQMLSKQFITEAYTYEAYLNLLNSLYEKGKTTGENHSEEMLNYAKMNLHRMNRLNKTIQLSDELITAVKSNSKSLTWLLITEGWCGDAAQNLPLLNKIAEQSNLIELKLILRDENLDIMDQFLTNGGRSIPKLIVLNSDTLDVIATWGPRPEIAQDMVAEFKKIPNGDYQEFQKELQLWYAKDKTKSMQSEFISLLKNWNS